RDRSSPGLRDYEPGMTGEAEEVEKLVRERAPPQHAQRLPLPGDRPHLETANSASSPPLEPFLPPLRKENRQTAPPDPPCPPLLRGGEDALVADVVVVDETEWWVGYHR